MATCKVEDCGKQSVAQRVCVNHYAVLRRRGVLQPLRRPTAEDRFWAKVNKTATCWNWTGSSVQNGYGKFYLGGVRREVLSHRLSIEWANGPIPEGMDVDHKCHNRACVNPDHLRLTTRKQNMENLQGAYATSTSGVRGVHWSSQKGKWRARVTHNRHEYNAGFFDTVEEAEESVIQLRRELFTHNDADRRSAAS